MADIRMMRCSRWSTAFWSMVHNMVYWNGWRARYAGPLVQKRINWGSLVDDRRILYKSTLNDLPNRVRQWTTSPLMVMDSISNLWMPPTTTIYALQKLRMAFNVTMLRIFPALQYSPLFTHQLFHNPDFLGFEQQLLHTSYPEQDPEQLQLHNIILTSVWSRIFYVGCLVKSTQGLTKRACSYCWRCGLPWTTACKLEIGSNIEGGNQAIWPYRLMIHGATITFFAASIFLYM